MYFIVDGENIVGKSKIKTAKCVNKAIKPFQEKCAKWDGSSFVYFFEKLVYSSQDSDIFTYLKNQFNYWVAASRRKDTLNVFDKENYSFINTSPLMPELDNTTFDVVFLDVVYTDAFVDINWLVSEQKKIVIKKEILSELEKFHNQIDKVFYLLKNYSCFITSINKGPADCKYNFCDPVFVDTLLGVSFDKTAKRLAANIPLTGYNAITFTLHKICNQHCPYCFENGTREQTLTDEQMYENFDKALSRMEKLLNKKILILLMGGEPTLWSDWLQNKILERIKDYKEFIMFTNGYNKNSPLYTSPKCSKLLHLLNWQKEINQDYPEDTIPVVVVQEDEDLSLLKNYNGSRPVSVQVVRRYTSNADSITNIDLLRKVAAIDNDKIYAFISKSFIKSIDKLGLEKARRLCQKIARSYAVDCNNMTVSLCCSSRKNYPVETFNFTEMPSWEEECLMCDYCTFFTNVYNNEVYRPSYDTLMAYLDKL